MKKVQKRLLGVAFLLAMMMVVACSAFAASKPAVEIMRTSVSINSAGGASPRIGFKNNSGKTIKYIEFTMVPYNAVDDAVTCEIRGYSSVVGRVTGPIETFSMDSNSKSREIEMTGYPSSNPFKKYYELEKIYRVCNGKYELWPIYADQYGNYYVQDSANNPFNPNIYLTDDEAQNATYDQSRSWDCLWYNSTIRSIKVTKAVVTYMDGTQQTLSQNELYSDHYMANLTYKPYYVMLDDYSAVYDYAYYKAHNADLAALYGDNQWKYLEHFINSGMKEGRQGCAKFSLEAYKEKNPDLVAAFGDDNQKYYEHYISSGKNEGRKAV